MKLYYKSYGTGQPVIFLHGLFGMGDNLRTVTKAMESRYQCILVDLRNHGRSPHDPLMNFQVMAKDIDELLNDLHLEKANFLGHSLGGKVAMQYALDHADSVQKLIVVDIAPKAYPPHQADVIHAIQSIDPGQIAQRSEAEQAFIQILGEDQSTIQFLLKNLSRLPDSGFEWKANMPAIIEAYDQIMEDISIGEPFQNPTLFIRGEKSNYIMDGDLPRIKEVFLNSSLVTIPDAGHWVHADQPDLFAQQVLGFLNDQLPV